MQIVKTWLDSEIIDLMVTEAREYRHSQQLLQKSINYREMMECILAAMQNKGLIEDTP